MTPLHSSPILMFHVVCAVLGLVSGYLAIFLRKGSGLHGAAGSVFFVSMLGMASSGGYISTFIRPIMINKVVSLLTIYLVLTAWRAARRREASWDRYDLAGLLFILAVGAVGIASGFEAALGPTGMKDMVPAGVYFFLGACALLCGVMDVRMYLRGGVAGARRVLRHLLRMSFALFIATFSLYPGQARLFPKWLRDTNLQFVPHVVLVGSILFYAVRVSRRKRAERAPEVVAAIGERVMTRAA